jgi:hypothetical protein
MRPHLCVKESRLKVIDQLVKIIQKTVEEKKLKPLGFNELIENLPSPVNLKLNKADLPGEFASLQVNEVHDYKMYLKGYHKRCNYNWRPEDIRRVSLEHFKGLNSGALLWGPKGCGKS